MAMFDADGCAIDFDPLDDLDSLEIETVEPHPADLAITDPFDAEPEQQKD